MARRFHRFLRARPQHPGTDRPVTINVWEAVYFDHRDHDKLLELARLAAAVGVERYVLDDGWFGARRDDSAGLGDWTVSPDVWPEGLHPLVDARHRRWACSSGCGSSPRWSTRTPTSPGRTPSGSWRPAAGSRSRRRRQQVINLGIPECYAYIRDQIFAILAEYDIGYIKWDHNRDLVDAGTSPTGRPGVHEQTLAFYRLVDEIKAAHPGLEIESCSSGGARVDLGVLERTDRVWVSDCIDPLERQQMHRWTTQLIPPELMGSHIASGRSHTTGRHHELRFRAATAIWGHLGVEWDLTQRHRDRAGRARRLDRLLQGAPGPAARRRPRPDRLPRRRAARRRRRRATTGAGAIYSFASVSRSDVALAGAGPAARARPRPALRRHARPCSTRPRPASCRRPGGTCSVDDRDDVAAAQSGRLRLLATDDRGPVVLSGAVLMRSGLLVAPTHPEQVAIYLVEAVD